MNFWQQLPRPFFVLAPMDDVTDVVFRQIVARAAAPDVLFTEFTSTDGLQSAGREITLERLQIEPNLSRPLVAQIWGKHPEAYYRAAREIAAMGFAGIDINLGCPDAKLVARGCCGGLIGNHSLVAEIVAATKAGAPELPISVKTRLGLRETITEDWAGFLLGLNLAALTIHGRTVAEMSRVPARWDEIAKVVRLRDQLAPNTPVIGNGDVQNRAHGEALAQQTSVDGIMIGRGIFHNLFAFDPTPRHHTPAEMLTFLDKHLNLYEQTGSQKSFHTLKKFVKVYINGWPGAADARLEMLESTSYDQLRTLVTQQQLIHSPAPTRTALAQTSNR